MESSLEQLASLKIMFERLLQLALQRTIWTIVLSAVYSRDHRIFFHQSGVERFEAFGYKCRVRHPGIQPQFVIFPPQNHGHTIMYIGDQRVWLGSKDRACFQDVTAGISPPI